MSNGRPYHVVLISSVGVADRVVLEELGHALGMSRLAFTILLPPAAILERARIIKVSAGSTMSCSYLMYNCEGWLFEILME